MAKIERTKNATRNIFYGFVLRFYQIIVPFFIRTAMIYLLGIEYLGLNSLFTSILQVLNLAELGVGSAMVYSMYKPIVIDDYVTICALMNLYKKYYRIIGLAIGVVGAFITPFVPRLITGSVPSDVNIYILYLLNLGATVISYWLFAYKNSILQAHQRVDIISKVTMIVNTIQYLAQFVCLYFFRNYYCFVIILLLSQVMINVCTAICANKLYPQYLPKGKVPDKMIKDINQRCRDLFTSKIGGVVYDSADTIVISAFLGLACLAVYQNYFFILSAVTSCITVIFSSCTAGIGNSIVVESKEKNFRDLNKFTFIICWITGICSCCLLNVYQPFMELWVGKELMFTLPVVICFVLYFFIKQLNSLLNLYKDASGMWHEDRFRPLAASLANLLLNLILVQIIGIYGILLSTVLAIVLVGMPWLLYNLFTIIFEKKNLLCYLRRILLYSFGTLVACGLTYLICICINYNLFITIILRLFICLFVPNVVFLLMYRRNLEFTESLLLVNKMLKGKIYWLIKLLGVK